MPRVGAIGTNLLMPAAILGTGVARTGLFALRGADVRALPVRLSLPAFRRPVLRVMTVGAGLASRLHAFGIPMMLDSRPGPLRLARMLRTLAGRPLRMVPRARLTLRMRLAIAARVPLSSLPVLAARAVVRLDMIVPAAMIAMGASAGRSCDRHRSHTCGEKQPGHHNFSFQREKRPVGVTVPTFKRMEPAG